MDQLDVLVGNWTMGAASPGRPPWPGEGRLSFECGTFRQHYFDSRGVRRVYEMTFDGKVWRMWRNSPDPFPQRFSATVSADGRTITGRWEKAQDGESWDVDFDLTYRKAG